jgi:hypothetical protein
MTEMTDSRSALFLFGAFGGIMPTLANLATTYVAIPATPMPAVGLLFGLALFAVIGGGVALTNTSREIRQAIFAGIAAPAIMTSIIAGSTPFARAALIKERRSDALSLTFSNSGRDHSTLARPWPSQDDGALPARVDGSDHIDVQPAGSVGNQKHSRQRHFADSAGVPRPELVAVNEKICKHRPLESEPEGWTPEEKKRLLRSMKKWPVR